MLKNKNHVFIQKIIKITQKLLSRDWFVAENLICPKWINHKKSVDHTSKSKSILLRYGYFFSSFNEKKNCLTRLGSVNEIIGFCILPFFILNLETNLLVTEIVNLHFINDLPNQIIAKG